MLEDISCHISYSECPKEFNALFCPPCVIHMCSYRHTHMHKDKYTSLNIGMDLNFIEENFL